MINRIVVAFDGSELSREAFAHAAMLAERSDSKISVLAVHLIEPTPPPAMMGEAVAAFDPSPVLAQVEVMDRRERAEEKSWAEREFATLAEHCSRRGVRFKSHVESGRVIGWLLSNCGESDLIALGMKGRFARAGIGSATKSLVKNAPCPVLVVGRPVRNFDRIVAVFDGSNSSRRAMHWAESLAIDLGIRYRLFVTSSDAASIEQTRREAEGLVASADILDYEPVKGNEAEQIEHFAQKAGRDLLVLGAYPDAWLHQLLFGGMTAHVVTHVSAPLILVP